MNLLDISQIYDQNFMVLFSKGKCLIMDESGKKLISGVRTLNNCYGLVPDADIVVIAFVYQIKIYGTKGWDMLVTNIFQLYLSISQC